MCSQDGLCQFSCWRPHQPLQKLIKNLQQVIKKLVQPVGLTLVLCTHLFPRAGTGMYGPGRISALIQVGWSISARPSVMDLQRPWYPSGSIANGATELQLLSHAHFMELKNAITPLLPTQTLEQPPLYITWLARHSWINFLLSTASWEFQIPEGTLPH